MVAQSSEIDKVTDAFGQERVQYLNKTYPDSVNYYQFIAESGGIITLQKNIPNERLETASTIDIPESCIKDGVPIPSCINILKLPIPFNPTQKMYYLIKGTEYALVIRSSDYLSKKYNAKPK